MRRGRFWTLKARIAWLFKSRQLWRGPLPGGGQKGFDERVHCGALRFPAGYPFALVADLAAGNVIKIHPSAQGPFMVGRGGKWGKQPFAVGVFDTVKGGTSTS